MKRPDVDDIDVEIVDAGEEWEIHCVNRTGAEIPLTLAHDERYVPDKDKPLGKNEIGFYCKKQYWRNHETYKYMESHIGTALTNKILDLLNEHVGEKKVLQFPKK